MVGWVNLVVGWTVEPRAVEVDAGGGDGGAGVVVLGDEQAGGFAASDGVPMRSVPMISSRKLATVTRMVGFPGLGALATRAAGRRVRLGTRCIPYGLSWPVAAGVCA